MEDDALPPDGTALSKLAGLLGSGKEKGGFSSTVVVDPKFGASDFASVDLFKVKSIVAAGATSATDEEANGTGAKAEPDGVPVTVFSSAGRIFCADLSSERLESLSPSQKGFSASLTGGGTRGASSVCVDDAVKFNTGTGTGGAGVFTRN